MKISITSFKGMVPGVNPRLLGASNAEVSRNVRLDDGSLTPFCDAKRVTTFPTSCQSFFRRNDESWKGYADDFVKAANGAENADRTYVTGNDAPKIILPSGDTINMALPRPTMKLKAKIVNGDLDKSVALTSYYVFTYYTELGEESPPSIVSNSVYWSPGQSIKLTNLPSFNPNADRLLAGIRIYRSQTDSLGATDFYFLTEIEGWPGSYTDVTNDTDLTEAITTTDFDPPPDDMQGIISLPNGMMAAFSGNELFFCEPYIHQAWPDKYSLKVNYEIVGLGCFGSYVVILTKGTPYIAQGTLPESMVMEAIDVDLPCVSANGIVSMGGSVIYPSPDGLVQVSASGATVISSALFSRVAWAKMQPETFSAGRHRGRYVFSYQPMPGDAEDEETQRRIGIVDTSGQQPFFIDDDSIFTGLYTDVRSGDLFGLFDGKAVCRWDDLDQDPRNYVWRSRPLNLPSPVNFGVVRVEGDDYRNGDLTCRIFANMLQKDGSSIQKIVRTIRGPRNNFERLPGHFLSDCWWIEIEGCLPVTAVILAGTPDELATQSSS